MWKKVLLQVRFLIPIKCDVNDRNKENCAMYCFHVFLSKLFTYIFLLDQFFRSTHIVRVCALICFLLKKCMCGWVRVALCECHLHCCPDFSLFQVYKILNPFLAPPPTKKNKRKIFFSNLFSSRLLENYCDSWKSCCSNREYYTYLSMFVFFIETSQWKGYVTCHPVLSPRKNVSLASLHMKEGNLFSYMLHNF